jgi:hypothetical protein
MSRMSRIDKGSFKDAAEGPALVRSLASISALGIGSLVRKSYDRWYQLQVDRQWLQANQEAVQRHRAVPATLSAAGARVLADLNAHGWAAAAVTDFMSRDRWERAKASVEAWIASDEVQGLERAYIEGHARHQKPYLVRKFGRDAAFTWPSLWLEIAIEPDILNTVNSYLGLWSHLRYVDVWDTVAKEHDGPDQASQRWHRDPEDRRLVKTFLYFSDVDRSAGAMQYVPHSRRGEKYGGLWPQKFPAGVTLKADELEARIPETDWVTCALPAGTLLFVDTVGFHRGGRAVSRRRVLATWTYSSPASPWPRAFTLDERTVPADISDAARFALMLNPDERETSR